MNPTSSTRGLDSDGPMPQMIRWAREEIGLEIEDAAKKLGLRQLAHATPVERLLDFELGRSTPPPSILEKMTKVYRVPLVALYLSNPPQPGDHGKDFRVMRGVTTTRQQAAALKKLLQNIFARQDYLRYVLEDSRSRLPVEFIGSTTKDDDVHEVVQSMSRLVNADAKGDLWDVVKSPAKLFTTLRERIERVGVFVMSVSASDVLGEVLDERIFRGLAIADNVAPMIVINGRDSTEAQSFTLMHEFTHLLLNETGVSNHPSIVKPRESSEEIERFCNDVAAEYLIPSAALGEVKATLHHSGPELGQLDAEAFAHAVAKARSVSVATASFRLARSKSISAPDHDRIIRQIRKRYHVRRDAQRILNAQRQRARRTTSSNPVARVGTTQTSAHRKRLGNSLINTVQSLLGEEKITHTKAAFILGANPTEVSYL